MFQNVPSTQSDLIWLIPVLLISLSTILYRADSIPYLQELFFPADLKRGKRLLETEGSLNRETNFSEFDAVTKTLRDQNKIPKGLLDVEYSKLATEKQREKKFLMVYVTDGKQQPWHTEQDRWNVRDGGDGYWEMLAPYNRVNEALLEEIDERSFPNKRVSLALLTLFILASVYIRIT